MSQRIFDSWADLGENYLIGRKFWSFEQTRSNGYLYRQAYERLLHNPKSPWRRYGWDTHLEAK